MTFSGVNFICPLCQMTCGWNDRKKEYDAERVESERPDTLQYAHRVCVEKVVHSRTSVREEDNADVV